MSLSLPTSTCLLYTSRRNHKIVTDTGIVLTFPAEYSHNTELIEFKSAPNGLIQIELKNIGSIENR